MKKLLKLWLPVALLATLCACKPEEEYGTIYGIVRDVETYVPLSNVKVTLSPGGAYQMTGNDGRFEFTELEIYQYTITVQKEGYSTNRKQVNVIAGESVEANIPMSKRK